MDEQKGASLVHEEFDIEELSEGLMLVQGMSKRGA
jgi:hypothetical protein